MESTYWSKCVLRTTESVRCTFFITQLLLNKQNARRIIRFDPSYRKHESINVFLKVFIWTTFISLSTDIIHRCLPVNFE